MELEITLYRMICQRFPEPMHDSGAGPSRVQETPGEGQTGRLRITKQSYSRRLRNSLWGDMMERILIFVRFNRRENVIVIPALPYEGGQRD